MKLTISQKTNVRKTQLTEMMSTPLKIQIKFVKIPQGHKLAPQPAVFYHLMRLHEVFLILLFFLYFSCTCITLFDSFIMKTF